MRNTIVTPTKNTRELTKQEFRFMRLKHLAIIPVFLLVGLFLWVITVFDSLLEPVRWAGSAIAILAAAIFIVKHIKMELDIRNGVVHIIKGEIRKKIKYGGSRKNASRGILSNRRSNKSSSSTYLIIIDDTKYNVPRKIYSKVKEGQKVEMNYFPKSQFYLGISVVEEKLN